MRDGELALPADRDLVAGLSSSLGVTLPSDYLNFLEQHNGGEGYIGDNYVILWKAEELERFNREYEVEKYAPGVLFFGSSGGGEGYGFDTRSTGMPIVCVPFIGMSREYAELVANDFPSFIDKLAISL